MCDDTPRITQVGSLVKCISVVHSFKANRLTFEFVSYTINTKDSPINYTYSIKIFLNTRFTMFHVPIYPEDIGNCIS